MYIFRKFVLVYLARLYLMQVKLYPMAMYSRLLSYIMHNYALRQINVFVFEVRAIHFHNNCENVCSIFLRGYAGGIINSKQFTIYNV